MSVASDDEFCFVHDVRGEEEEGGGDDSDTGAPSPFNPALQAETEDNASINRFLELDVLPEEPQPASGSTPAATATAPKLKPSQEGTPPPQQQQQQSSNASSFNAWHSNPHFHTSPPTSPRRTTNNTPVHTSSAEANDNTLQAPSTQPPTSSEHLADGQPGLAPEGTASTRPVKSESPAQGTTNSSSGRELHGARSNDAASPPASIPASAEHSTHVATHAHTEPNASQPHTAPGHPIPTEDVHTDQPLSEDSSGTSTNRIRVAAHPPRASTRTTTSTRSSRGARKECVANQPCMPRLFACLLLCMCCGRMLEHMFAWLHGARASLLPSLQGADWPSVAVEISQWFMTAAVFFSALVSLNVMNVKRSRAARRMRARGLRMDWLAVCTMVLALTAHFCVVTVLCPRPGGFSPQHHQQHDGAFTAPSEDAHTCDSSGSDAAAAHAATVQATVQVAELRQQLAQRDLELAQKAEVIKRLLEQKQQHAANAHNEAVHAQQQQQQQQQHYQHQQQQQQKKEGRVYEQLRWPWSSFGSSDIDAAGPTVDMNAASGNKHHQRTSSGATSEPTAPAPPKPAPASSPPPDSAARQPGQKKTDNDMHPGGVHDMYPYTPAAAAAAAAAERAVGGGAVVLREPGQASTWARALRRASPANAALAVRQHTSSFGSALAQAVRSTAHGIQARGVAANNAAARMHASVRAAAYKGGLAVWQHSADAYSRVRAMQQRAARAVHAGAVACGGWVHNRGTAFGRHMHTRSVALYHRMAGWFEKLLLTARYVARAVHRPRDAAADARRWLQAQRELHVLPRLQSMRDSVKGLYQKGAAGMRLRWRSPQHPQNEEQQHTQQQAQQQGQQQHQDQHQEQKQKEGEGDAARAQSSMKSGAKHSRLRRMRNLVHL